MNTKNSLFFLGLFFLIFLMPTSSQLSFADAGSILIHSFDVAYDIENGIVESMYLDPDFIELIITMDTTSDGTFEITIPRILLDAKFETSDDIFFVLVDGFETDYVEKETSSTSRTLVIPFFGGDSIIDIIGTTALNPFIVEPEIEIPSWIKNNAEWWASNQIDDKTFVQGIQYLITNGIMNIPETKSGESSGKEIPSWIKNNAEWWASNQIDDKTFVQGIQYLITNGIMTV